MTAPAGPTLAAEAARKAIHLGTAALPILWALDILGTAQLRGALSIAVLFALGVEFARHRRGPFAAGFDRVVGRLLRVHERRGISGATWLALGMCAVVWLAPREAAIVALWAAAVGDATAGLLGRAVQQVRRQADGTKSAAGSLGALAATTGGALWLTSVAFPAALVLGFVAAVAERPAGPGDDNVRVTLAVAAAAILLGLR